MLLTLVTSALATEPGSRCAVLRSLADVNEFAARPIGEVHEEVSAVRANEGLRLELALRVIRRDPRGFVEHLSDYRLTNKAYKIAALRALAEADSTLAIEAYDKFGFGEKQHGEALTVLRDVLEKEATQRPTDESKGTTYYSASEILRELGVTRPGGHSEFESFVRKALRPTRVVESGQAVKSREARRAFWELISRLPLSDSERVSMFTQTLSRLAKSYDSEQKFWEHNPDLLVAAFRLRLTDPRAIATLLRKLHEYSSEDDGELAVDLYVRINGGFNYLSPKERYELGLILFQSTEDHVSIVSHTARTRSRVDIGRALARYGRFDDLTRSQRLQLAHQFLSAGLDVPGFLAKLGVTDPSIGKQIEAMIAAEDFSGALTGGDAPYIICALNNSEALTDPSQVSRLANGLLDKLQTGASKSHFALVVKAVARFIGRSCLPGTEKAALLDRLLGLPNVSTILSFSDLASGIRIKEKEVYQGLMAKHQQLASNPSFNRWETLADLSIDDRVEALQSVAAGGAPVHEALRELQIPRRRWLGILLAARNTEDGPQRALFESFNRLGLTRAERLALATRQIPRAVHPDSLIELSGLGEPDRLDLAILSLSTHSPLQFFKGESPAGKVPFGISSRERQLSLVGYAVRRLPADKQKEFLEHARRLFPLSGPEIQMLGLAADPLGYLQEAGALSPTSSHPEDPAALAELKGKLRAFAKKYPEALPTRWIDRLFDRIHGQETGAKLLQLFYRTTDYDPRKPLPSDSLRVLSDALGYRYADVSSPEWPSQRMANFYDFSLDISENLTRPAFGSTSIDPELFKGNHQRQTLDFLQRARDLHFLRGNTQSSWDTVLTELGLTGGALTVENIGRLNHELETKIVETMRELFKGQNLSLNYEQLAQLEASWGDIGPIKTLVARYQGRPEGNHEIPVVARIFESSLQGQFEKYKFEGRPDDRTDQEAAKSQLAMLKTSKQRQAWARIRTRISVFSPQEATQQADQAMQAARQAARNELLVNVEGGRVEAIPDVRRAAIIEAALASRDPSEALRDLLAAHYGGEDSLLAKREIITAIGERIMETPSARDAKRLAQSLRVWTNDMAMAEQTRNDASAVFSALQEADRSSSKKKALVFTTTFYHPKMMLMVGDLTGSRTCQSYSTGGMIQTLPGYVIDANVQGVASFALNEANFARRKDFDAVVSASERGLTIEIGFDAGKRLVTFSWDDGGKKTVTSQPLSLAYLRHILKVGVTADGKPGVALEPGKIQVHPANGIMSQHVAEIEAEVAKAIGGVTGEAITVPPSRNPGGVYSDRSGGVNTRGYTIRP